MKSTLQSSRVASCATTSLSLAALVLVPSRKTLVTEAEPLPLSVSWEQTSLDSVGVVALLIHGANLFAGTEYGVLLSTDTGTSWSTTGLTRSITDVAALDMDLYAGTDWYGIYRSSDGGTTWIEANSGLADLQVLELEVSGTYLYAGTVHGVYLSTNKGANWSVSGLTDRRVLSFAVRDSNLFAGAVPGVFRSTDKGTNWAPAELGNVFVASLLVGGTNLFAGTGYGVFRSTDDGASWGVLFATELDVFSLVMSGANLFAGTYGGGVVLSRDGGTHWAPVNAGLTSLYVNCMVVSGRDLLVGTRNGVFRGAMQ